MYPGTATKKDIIPGEYRAVYFYAPKKGKPKVPARTTPAANISETPAEYFIIVAAPGLCREDFSIQIKGSIISIAAQKEIIEYNAIDRWEYDYTDWARSFVLPKDADAMMAHATYQNGELMIRIPRGNNTGEHIKTTIYIY